jgi:hypothetical protein
MYERRDTKVVGRSVYSACILDYLILTLTRKVHLEFTQSKSCTSNLNKAEKENIIEVNKLAVRFA